MSDDSPQEHEYHLDRNNVRKLPENVSPPLPLLSLSKSEQFDDGIYTVSYYVPPTCTTATKQQQPKAENLGRSLSKKANSLKRSLKKRTESTSDLLGDNRESDCSEVDSHDRLRVYLADPPLPPKENKLSINQ